MSGARSDATQLFEHVARALDLIDTYDAAQGDALRRDLKRILISDSRGGQYLSGIRGCRVGRNYVLRASALELAMMIVHEGTHGALEQAGERYRGANKSRVEEKCIEAEIGFAERVPDSTRAIERSRRLLETRWWDVGENVETAVLELKGRGVPGWIARRLVARAARRERAGPYHR